MLAYPHQQTRLVLSDAENKKTVQLYMADVSAAFLDKLEHPESKTNISLQVFRDEVNSKPTESLRGRLLQRMFLTEETEGVQIDEERGIKRSRSEDEASILGRENCCNKKQCKRQLVLAWSAWSACTWGCFPYLAWSKAIGGYPIFRYLILVNFLQH